MNRTIRPQDIGITPKGGNLIYSNPQGTLTLSQKGAEKLGKILEIKLNSVREARMLEQELIESLGLPLSIENRCTIYKKRIAQLIEDSEIYNTNVEEVREEIDKINQRLNFVIYGKSLKNPNQQIPTYLLNTQEKKEYHIEPPTATIQ